jgi:hypothetical protein
VAGTVYSAHIKGVVTYVKWMHCSILEAVTIERMPFMLHSVLGDLWLTSALHYCLITCLILLLEELVMNLLNYEHSS